ncbi:MAG: zinc-binding alcohol dehydrogenase family protein [Actinomycetota bacterium]
MRAVGYRTPGTIDREESLIDLELERPAASGHDILVEIEAVSVNPVDTKVRASRQPIDGDPVVLGWDAVGTVVELGNEVTRFKVGDRVWYAGAINRSGTNAEYHLVDARIVGRAPESIGAAAAAALPLTALTAHEMLFDRLQADNGTPGGANAIVIVGGAGGVGSIAIQLARALTDLVVIATASRPETMAWVAQLGAHHVIDHRHPLPDQVAALGVGAPGFVFSTTHSASYVDQIAELIAPQGRFGLIDELEGTSIDPLKSKAVSIHWELMFTRSLFATPDMARQGAILDEIAALVDDGRVKSTATEVFGAINAHNLRRAHSLIETNTAKGKIVLEGFAIDSA